MIPRNRFFLYMTTISLINNKQLTANEVKDINNPKYILSDDKWNISVYAIINVLSNTKTIDADIYGINYEFSYDNEKDEIKITNVSLGERVGDISIVYKPEPFTIDDYCKINPFFDDNDRITDTSYRYMMSIIDIKNKQSNINTYIHTYDVDIPTPEWTRLNWDGNKIIYDEYIFALNCLNAYNGGSFNDLVTNISENKFTPPIHNEYLYIIYKTIKNSPSISYDSFSLLYNEVQHHIRPEENTIKLTFFQVSTFISIFKTLGPDAYIIFSIINEGKTHDIKLDLISMKVSFENNEKYIYFNNPTILDVKINQADMVDTITKDESLLTTDNVNIFINSNKEWKITITQPQYVFSQQVSIMDVGDRKLELTNGLLKYNDLILEGGDYVYDTIDDDYIYHMRGTTHIIDKINCLLYEFDIVDNKFLRFSSLLSTKRAFRTDNEYNKLMYKNYIFTASNLAKINQPVTINKYPTYNKYNAIALASKHMIPGSSVNINMLLDTALMAVFAPADSGEISEYDVLYYKSIINPRFEIL